MYAFSFLCLLLGFFCRLDIGMSKPRWSFSLGESFFMNVVSRFGLFEKRSTLGEIIQKSKVITTTHGESERSRIKGGNKQ